MVTRVGSLPSPSLRSRLVRTAALAIAIACAWGLPLSAQQGTPLRKIGELELAIRGLTATVEPRLTVPKNIASGVRIDVRAGAATATAADAVRLLGGEFRLKGELSGPGLTQTRSLPEGPVDVDPFLLRLPGLTRAGRYTLANRRLVRGEGEKALSS